MRPSGRPFTCTNYVPKKDAGKFAPASNGSTSRFRMTVPMLYIPATLKELAKRAIIQRSLPYQDIFPADLISCANPSFFLFLYLFVFFMFHFIYFNSVIPLLLTFLSYSYERSERGLLVRSLLFFNYG